MSIRYVAINLGKRRYEVVGYGDPYTTPPPGEHRVVMRRDSVTATKKTVTIGATSTKASTKQEAPKKAPR
jgi:hypothetical protein